jgi:hypothetical protein
MQPTAPAPEPEPPARRFVGWCRPGAQSGRRFDAPGRRRARWKALCSAASEGEATRMLLEQRPPGPCDQCVLPVGQNPNAGLSVKRVEVRPDGDRGAETIAFVDGH